MKRALCFFYCATLGILGSPLNQFVTHYEELTYDVRPVAAAHSRARRDVRDDVSSTVEIRLTLEGFGRTFPLVLHLQANGGETYRPNHVVEVDGKPCQHDMNYFYMGEVQGEPSSVVHGHIVNNTFGGIINSDDGQTYFVERAIRHFRGPQRFHSVMYREKDVKYPETYGADATMAKESSESRLKRSTNPSFCALHDNELRQQLRDQQRNQVRERRAADYSWARDQFRSDRSKRQTGYNTVCTLRVESDWLLWEYFRNNGLSGDEAITSEAVATINDMVTATRLIYERTVFTTYSNSPTYQGITFQIQRTVVSKQCQGTFCQRNLDVNNFLNEHSYTNYEEFCLSVLFTYRDFAQGTLGLAWVGDPGTMAGGICETYKLFREQGRDVRKSLNTAIVTLLNHGKRVDIAISRLTLAHELGHNFGSPHDTGSLCVPYQNNNNVGNYIMYAQSTSGRQTNNQDFSPCSRDNMTRVIDAVMNNRNGKTNCFKASGVAFCGNALVEAGEVCDCGYDSDQSCIDDKCCAGKNAAGGNDCQLLQGTCSPSMGPCCNHITCGNIAQSANVTCKAAGECHERTICDGSNYTCPTANFKPSNTLCAGNTKHCSQGECTESVCDLISDPRGAWVNCFPNHPDKNEKDFDLKKLCFLGCALNTTGTMACESSQSPVAGGPFAALLAQQGISEGILMPPGSPCDDYSGYCDVFNKCRPVDAEGPLTRLRKLLFSDESLRTVREWITKYWWAVALMVLGLFVFMGLFIKCCAVHTPSSNPNAPKARNFRDTLRRPSQMIRNRGQPGGRHRAVYEYDARRERVKQRH